MTRLACLDCDFVGQFSEAVDHYRDMGHRLAYRGVVQELASVVQRAKQTRADREAYEAAMRRDPTWPKDAA